MQPLRVPFNELGFLIQSDNPNFLQQLHLAENNFFNLMKIIRVYGQMRMAFYKPPKPQELAKDGAILPGSETAYNVNVLQKACDTIYHQMTLCSDELFKRHKQLAEFVNATFKNHKPLPPEIRVLPEAMP